jgi:hypothetical protein
MAVTAEESALAEQVVQKSKNEARVDTGRLKESINKKVQRGVIVFREYFYGQYESKSGTPNSTLEENAKKMMGNIPYKIERLTEDGNIEQLINKASSGRVISYEKQKKRESNAMKLMLRLIAKRKKDAESEKSYKDN